MILENLTQIREVFLDYIDMSSVALSSLTNLSSSLTSLSLVFCKLHGEFPEPIFRLPNLQFLNLMSNNDVYGNLPKSNWTSPQESLILSSTSFSGELPDSIGNLSSLMVLELSSCHFTGSIPASIGSLQQLIELDLSNNNWTGQIPDVFEKLDDLSYLSFSNSNFSGMLPSCIFNLTELYWLDLSQNNLEGSIVNQLCGFSKLINLDLSYNLLSAIIPSCVYGLPSLVWFSLSFNQLTGQLGELRSKSLKEIILESNKIHGPIHPSVFELTNLTNLHLLSNNLSGVVNLNMFSKLKNLWGLDLSDNHLSVVTSSINTSSNSSMWPQFYRLALSSCNISEFPEFLKTQNKLGYLSLSNNRIHGELPKWVSGKGMQYLQYLDLPHNLLTKVSQLPSNLQFLGLSVNLLQQPLPLLPPSMYILLVSNNKLTGEISPSLCNITTFQIIDLSNHSLSGIIPQCLGNFSSELSVLNLGMNSFKGSIPGTFAEGNKLWNLNLNGNQLEGQLPRNLANCKMLQVLDLGNNKINDSFPEWLATLPDLKVFVLRSNRSHGLIGYPEGNISPFPKLRIIDVSYNEFSSHLPTKYFSSLQFMKKVDKTNKKANYMGEIYYQDSVVLTLKGIDLPIERILTIFTAIDLSSNRFDGAVVDVIGNLSSLVVLNFSHNSLTGQIPSSLREFEGT